MSLPKTESQKIRESIPLSDAEIVHIARSLGLRGEVDPSGIPYMSHADWVYLAECFQQDFRGI